MTPLGVSVKISELNKFAKLINLDEKILEYSE